MEVQSVRLPKNKYNLRQAETKVKSMGYKIKYNGKSVKQYDAGESLNWWRFRQKSPNQFQNKSIKIKKIKDAQLVLGKRK